MENKFNLEYLTDVELDGIDIRDYPDFVDAYISYAYCKIRKRALDDDELEDLNYEHPDFIGELVYDSLF